MIDAEQSVIGALLRDNSLIEQYPLSPDDFSDPLCSRLYAGIRELSARDEPVDPISLAEQSSVDTATTTALWHESYVSSNFALYHRMVKRNGTVARARHIAAEMAECHSIDDIEDRVTRLVSLAHADDTHECDQVAAVKRAIDHLELIEGGAKPGLPTGLTALDTRLGGLHAGDLVVIAARSQHGKTALMMNMANAIPEPVGIISGEQPAEQLAMRSISLVGGVSLQRMRNGTLDTLDWQRIGDATKQLHDHRVPIFDKGGPSIAEITAVARQWRYNKGIVALFVDFLQLVTGGDGDQHRLQIGDVARRLKMLAKQLNIPVVALAQIKREVDNRPQGTNYLGRMPYAADLADSAQIEDAADQIITLYRPSVYWPNNEVLREIAYLNVAKNRHGQAGAVRVEWTGEFVRFQDRAA